MENIYVLIVVCLLLLAVFDLIVGVSNDAVNFLNSAFGSRVARRRTILIVASAGIALGAISSGGMMEIARKGIFNPEMFSFMDVMTIFLAVMITDILLLDFFNTYGMPTSTTVSLMFELLGAAFVVALIKIITTNSPINDLGDYLNASNAMLIISGIFLSVFIAFGFGVIVQFLTRSIFSFKLDQSVKRFGPFLGGIAITTITYFMLIKGLKGSVLMSKSNEEFIQQNIGWVLLLLLAFWTLVSFLLAHFLKVNILKTVVLSGTFALAMAFAGNDLVNFIGVPLAGLTSFETYQSSGVQASDLNMGFLATSVKSQHIYLFIAAIIMILTLWFSKKAESVTETEINLARESIGKERFKSNLLSRFFVKSGVKMGALSGRVIPSSFQQKLDQQFDKKEVVKNQSAEQPAFDLLRASVNLMLSSVLIASATSFKLPLSTTYVSFMVAMGTSLADRAWDRESAVYRVAGVINVISGWLFTAVVAFSSAGLLALVIYFGKEYAIIGLMLITAFVILKSHLLHAKKTKQSKNGSLDSILAKQTVNGNELLIESREKTANTLYLIGIVYKDCISGLHTHDLKKLKRAKQEIERFNHEHEDLIAAIFYYLKKVNQEESNESVQYVNALNYLQNLSQSIHLISDQVFNHVKNIHSPLNDEKMEELLLLSNKISLLFEQVSDLLLENKGNIQLIEDASNDILRTISSFEKKHIQRIKGEECTAKNSLLYLTILLESKDLIQDFNNLVNLFFVKEVSYDPINTNSELNAN